MKRNRMKRILTNINLKLFYDTFKLTMRSTFKIHLVIPKVNAGVHEIVTFLNPEIESRQENGNYIQTQ